MKLKHLSLISSITVATIAHPALAKQDEAPAADQVQQATEAANAVAQVLQSAKTDTSRAKGTARPWAHEKSDIKADSKTLYGTLDNGMRYIIHKNALPPERVSLRLHVDAGSLNEKESQRGVAHFLEHMVFNGTKTFPDATKLIPQMQRLGIAFGAHANAYTSFDETLYMLDLPDVKPSTIDLAFNVMGDFADGALLTDEEIDEERGVISSEKTARDSIELRMMQKQFKHLLPHSLLAERFPIGTEKVIAEAPRSEFVDFYTRFYTPEKMTFIIVGDIDIAAMEQRIVNTFGQMKNPAQPGAKASVGDLSGPKGFHTAVFTDKELSSTELSLVSIRKAEHKIDSIAKRKEKLPLRIANAILNRRFSRLAKQPESVITSGSAQTSILFKEAEIGSIDVTAKNNNWQAAIPVLEQEMRRALEHGFTQSEFDEIKASLLNIYEQRVATAATRKSSDIAISLAKHIHNDYIYSTPETDLEIFQANIKNITADTCHQAFTSFWNAQNVTLTLSTPKQTQHAEKIMASLFKRSKLVKVDAPKERKVEAFAYTTIGQPGKIIAQKHIQDLDVHQLEFENGVRINFKKTDFDKNQILISGYLGSGKLNMPKNKLGLDMLAGTVLNGGGLGKHSADDLRTILTGKNVNIAMGIEDDSITFSSSTVPEDLELQLQLICASLTDAGYRPEAERQFRAMLPMIYQQLKHTAKGAQAQMTSWLHGTDYRFTLPSLEQAEALTTLDVKKWLDPQLKSAALEIGIVGDFEEKTLIDLLSKTLGALPKREAPAKVTDAERTIQIPQSPATQKFTFDSKIPTATSIVAWKVKDNIIRDVKFARRISLLSQILSDRLRVTLREELGDVYSPGAASNLSQVFKNVGFITAYSPVKTKDQEKINEVIISIGDKLAQSGASEDEFKRAITPRIGMLKKTLRNNSYWLDTVIARSQSRPDMLDWCRERDSDYRSITLEEINNLAKQYFTKDRSLSISLTPAITEEH